jgi:hypothetical protein
MISAGLPHQKQIPPRGEGEMGIKKEEMFERCERWIEEIGLTV